MDELNKVSTVHEGMQLAALSSQSGPQVQVSFRLPDPLKEACHSICQRHGVTLSEFLRAQCVLLAKDYGALQM